MDDHIETRPTHKGGTISRWRNVLIEFPTQQSGESVRTMISAARDWFKGKPKSYGILVVLTEVVTQQGLPGEDFRTALTELWQQCGDVVAAHALVYPGTGFAAAGVRAFLTSLNLVLRKSFPRAIEATDAQACVWLARTLEKSDVPCGTALELESAVRRIRVARG